MDDDYLKSELRDLHQEIDDLTNHITRLVRGLEEDDRMRARVERLAEEERDARHAFVAQQLAIIFDKLSEHHTITRDDILSVIRQAVDEVRQGLALRAMGASPWPPAVPPSTPIHIESEKPDRGDPDSVSIQVERGLTTVRFPKLTWTGAFTALKWAVAVGATGTTLAVIGRSIWKAIIGE